VPAVSVRNCSARINLRSEQAGKNDLSSKYFGFLALWLALAAPVARAETSEAEQIQAALESWVVERAPAEKITGVAAYISFGHPGPAIEAFAGKTGPDSQDPPER
jgi:hypothetical protein